MADETKTEETKSTESNQKEATQEKEEKGKLYGRVWRVLIYKKEEGKAESKTALDVSDLKCVFKVMQNPLGQAWVGEVTIYNLNASSEAEIIKEGFILVIEAGYKAQYGKIFEGDIVQVIRNRENGTDYTLQIVAFDGLFLDKSFIDRSIIAGSTPRKIIETCVKTPKLEVEIGNISDNLSERSLPRGKVFFGEAKKYLRDVAEGNDALYWIEDRKLIVQKPTDEIPEDKCLVLTPTTGLIGTPVMENDGIHIKMLLHPKVRPMTMIKIDNEIIRRQKINLPVNGQPVKQTNQTLIFDQDGEYQVFLAVHYGDTCDNDWYTEVVGIGRNGRQGLPIPINSPDKSMTRGA